jgi:hypothetical protein
MSSPKSRTQEHEEQQYAVESTSQEAQRDTRFVPETQLTTKVTYVFVEEPTKGRVSFNPNPSELPPRSTRFFTINP